ncbi:hypothetical protein HOY80DRAFT_1106492 [Tuber brumale]|nr:hypothetical protein HOY80DRAFT_1106492 [Tuber brumale]
MTSRATFKRLYGLPWKEAEGLLGTVINSPLFSSITNEMSLVYRHMVFVMNKRATRLANAESAEESKRMWSKSVEADFRIFVEWSKRCTRTPAELARFRQDERGANYHKGPAETLEELPREVRQSEVEKEPHCLPPPRTPAEELYALVAQQIAHSGGAGAEEEERDQVVLPASFGHTRVGNRGAARHAHG